MPPVSTTKVVHLELWISPWIFEKIWNGPFGIPRAWGKLIHEKNLKSKILWHCPFKAYEVNHAVLIITSVRAAFAPGCNLSLNFTKDFHPGTLSKQITGMQQLQASDCHVSKRKVFCNADIHLHELVLHVHWISASVTPAHFMKIWWTWKNISGRQSRKKEPSGRSLTIISEFIYL
jgi:hypothetical protein